MAGNLHAHLVFDAKYRPSVSTPEMLNSREHPMAQVCTDFEATLAEFKAAQDHVHLLAAYPCGRRLAVSDSTSFPRTVLE